VLSGYVGGVGFFQNTQVGDPLQKKYFHIDDSLEMSGSHSPSIISPRKVKEKRQNDNNTVAKFLNLGYYIVTPIVLGVVVGLIVDRTMNSSVFIKVFLFVGIAGTFYNLIKIVKETHIKSCQK
jgi:F0F1-type ATP synthase assembly protein I